MLLKTFGLRHDVTSLAMTLESVIVRFSIIIPTRDRPALFGEALASVIAQNYTNFEIIVVNDGSLPDNAAANARIIAGAREQPGTRLRDFSLIRRPNGHGPSYALNYGVSQAVGDYVGFLDDDDAWIEHDHLARADAALAENADVYMSNQRAFILGEEISEKLWLGSLAPRLLAEGRTPDAHGNFAVSAEDLISTPGFCHLNGLIVRRSFFETIDGLDETIRWEGDRDLFLRLIDAGGTMLHNPREIARHNIPDPGKTANMTTAISDTQKRLSQLRVVDKAATLAKHPLIRAHGRQHRGFVCQKIAENLEASGDMRGAAAYARSAFGSRPSIGGWLTAMRYSAIALFSK
jgi:glycosyltransferase involved in cell wall biosynthesis